MKKTLVFVFFLFINISFTSAEEIEIDDFGRQIESLDYEYQHHTFDNSFKCGDKATFQAAKDMCEVICRPIGNFGNACESRCIPPDIRSEMVTVEIVNCSSHEVTLLSSDGDVRKITRDDFIKYKKNPLREFLRVLPEWIEGAHKIQTFRKTRVKHTLGWKTSYERQVSAWQFEVTLSAHIGSGVDDSQYIFTVITDQSVPWFVQLARVRIFDEGTMWRLHDL